MKSFVKAVVIVLAAVIPSVTFAADVCGVIKKIDFVRTSDVTPSSYTITFQDGTILKNVRPSETPMIALASKLTICYDENLLTVSLSQ